MQGIRRTIKRRRLECKTDYKSRFGLLKSGKMRLVVRKTNRYILLQIVQSEGAQDKVIINLSSKELLEKGWPKSLEGSLKSLAAAYLAGMLLADKSKKSKIGEVIVDMGLQRNIKGGRIYAAIRGAVDGGLNVACGKESLPSDKDLERNPKTREAFIKVRDKFGDKK